MITPTIKHLFNMSNLQQRNYYKIFTGTNQTGGYEKLHLGYEAKTIEIVFKADNTTYFHVPFFASVQSVLDSTLVGDGAVPGIIPALSDRIFKKQGGYENTTPWGKSLIQDGTWLCSWLYKESDSDNTPPVWYDRYYNPGFINYTDALQQGVSTVTEYSSNNPIYIDVVSQLTLEPGVLYQYYHNGEKSATDIVKTFAGNNNDRLKLNIDNWNENTVDSSIYNNSVVIDNFKPNWISVPYDPGYTDRSILTFDNTDFIDAKVIYNETYSLPDEFTLSFWVYNKDWGNATSTQLVGNLNKGGYSVMYNNLNYNPFYVVPESTYGHLLYFNQDNNNYYDQNLGASLIQISTPVYTSINSNSEVIVLDSNNSLLSKYDHQGSATTYSKYSTGDIFYLPGTAKQLAIDGNNNTIVVTTSGTYIFDQSLTYQTSSSTIYTPFSEVIFDANGNIQTIQNCLAAIYDKDNTLWTIEASGDLYRTLPGEDKALYLDLPATTTARLAIDPYNNLWIVNYSSDIIKLNLDTLTTTNISIGTTQPNDSTNFKNISFINTYDRLTNSFAWYALLYSNIDKILYQADLNGNVLKITNLPNTLFLLDPLTSAQNNNNLTFTCKGDFTGYEWRRIFNNSLYRNNSQMQFKIATRTPSPFNTLYYTYTLSVPVQYLTNNMWHLITATYKNNTLSLFINDLKRGTLTIPSNLLLNYDFRNNLYVGTPNGKSDNLNKEINSISVIWNGAIDSIKIYDYAIDPAFIKYFIREKTISSDIVWNVQTTPLQYIETIDRFFKHRVPGSKSNFFNIKINGTQITDPDTRLQIENNIIQSIQTLKPAYTELLNVEWLD
jgi:hypothetical protein